LEMMIAWRTERVGETKKGRAVTGLVLFSFVFLSW
jgi:hypothetical protein